MTTIPIELATARQAVTEAWNSYQTIIEREHTSAEFDAALTAAQQTEAEASQWYRRWQDLGGTSDIHSIVESENAWMSEAIAQAQDARESFDEYMKNTYPKERDARAIGWREWKKNHPNASPYHFSE